MFTACFGMAVGLAVLSFISKEHENLAVAVLVATLTLYGFSAAGFMVIY